jgi:hypothetical protein
MHDIGEGMMEMGGVFYRRLIEFLPNFFVALVLFLVGLAIARLLGFIVLRTFKAVNVDRFWESAGIREVLARGGVRRPVSVELARLVSWLTVLVFAVIALNALHIPVIDTVLARFFLYLPNVFAALLILLAGLVLGNFFSRAVLITLVNSGVREAGLLARAARVAIFVFAVTMALEQLDIGKISVLIAFAIIFGGVVLALALAFGVAARPYIREYLSKRIEEGKGEGDDHIEPL